jgi:Flp pilus assembly protein TadG
MTGQRDSSQTWLARLTQRLRGDARGSVVIMFALSLSVICGLMGAAIDYGRITGMQRRITTAVEITAEAAAMRPDLLDGDMRAFAERYFKANGGDKPPIRDVRFRIRGDSNGIWMRVEADLPTTMMAMLGRPFVPIVVERNRPWRIVKQKKKRKPIDNDDDN